MTEFLPSDTVSDKSMALNQTDGQTNSISRQVSGIPHNSVDLNMPRMSKINNELVMKNGNY